MLKHYFTLAIRHLVRNKFYSFISLLGLSLGMAAFLVVTYYIRFELSYETMHPHAERVYRVTQDFYRGDEYLVTDCETPPPLAPRLKADFPEVETFVRMQDIDQKEFVYKNQKISVKKVIAGDPTVFDVFGYEILHGEPQKYFDQPFHAVVSRSIAEKHFGTADAIGKVLTMRASGKGLKIVGVMEDIPQNTHLKFDVLLSFKSLVVSGLDLNSWESNNNFTYIRATAPLNLEAFNKRLFKLSKELDKGNNPDIYQAEPIRDIHLHSHKTFEPEANSDIKVIYFLSVIAGFILLISLINYMNLYTAKSLEKSKEISVRQMFGATHLQMIGPSLIEAAILSVFAALLSLVWLELSIPFLNRISDQVVNRTIYQHFPFWVTFGALLLGSTLVAGFYAQFMLSFFKIRDALRGTPKLSRKSLTFQKIFVVGQYVATFALVIGTFIVIKQIRFMMSQELGMKPDQALVVKVPGGEYGEAFEKKGQLFKKEVAHLSSVLKVGSSNSLPGSELHELSSTSGFRLAGAAERGSGNNYYFYSIDAAFIPAMGMELAVGKNFDPHRKKSRELIINEETARIFGFSDPQEALNRKIKMYDDQPSEEYGKIVGVVKNFHQQSLKEGQLPMVFFQNEKEAAYFVAKVNTRHIKETTQQVEAIFKEVYKDEVFDYFFLDDYFNRQYHNEVKFAKLSSLFSLLAIFISGIGLIGISSYVALRRTKEVAIRKVLGASMQNILLILSSSYLKRILIACAIATPLTYLALRQWLQGFAYRTEINWWMFPVGALLLVVLAFVMMSIQGVKAALANPIQSLRDE